MSDAEKVLIAYPHGQEVDASFHASMLRLVFYDLNHNKRFLYHNGEKLNIDAINMGPLVVAARNVLVERFLTTDIDWLLFIDTDMYFPNNAVDQLFEVADAVEAPMVGGYCMTAHQTKQYTDEYYTLPTIYVYDEEHQAYARPTENDVAKMVALTKNPVVTADATGCAFLLIHRSVLEKMRDEDPDVKAGKKKFFIWFREDEHDGKMISEDIRFCHRAKELGFPDLRIHTGVRIYHRKVIAL